LENEMLDRANRENTHNLNILLSKNDELVKSNYQKDENLQS